MQRLLFSMFASFALTSQAFSTETVKDFKTLQVGPGPEDICVAEWRGQPIVITCCSQRVKGKPECRDELGFRFIALRHGEPEIIGQQNLDAIPGAANPWSGLTWQPKCVLNHGKGVLVGARTPYFAGKQNMDKNPGADLFVWDEQSSTPRLKLLPCKLPKVEGTHSFNAVVVTTSGDVYGTCFGLTASWPDIAPCHEPATKLNNNCLYRWKRGAAQWECVAKHISGANGLALSADGKQLAVAAYHSKKILFFDLTEDLKKPSYVRLQEWNPDNLKLLPDGSLAACGSGWFSTGIKLLLANAFGCTTKGDAPGAIFSLPFKPQTCHPVPPAYALPHHFQCPSGVAKLGPWWAASQILGDEVVLWKDSRVSAR